jgi:DNA-binding beta-propeller fold protein YncE
LAVYLGCGEVDGPGTVIQLDRTGMVLGTVRLPGTPYGLALHKDGFVAAMPSSRGKQGKVIRFDGQGNVQTLLQDNDPIAIAADPGSGDILVADNVADVLVLLPAGKPESARTVIQIKGHEGHFQDMSVAFARDGYLLFGSDGPIGIYRFRAAKNATLGQPVLPEAGAVAADPSSKRWAAALPNELRVFEDTRELLKLPYPAGERKWHDTVAFGPDGTLVIALHVDGTNYDVVLADLKAKTFHLLFSWNQSRVVSVAVGRKTTWKK